MIHPKDLKIDRLGAAKFPSPLEELLQAKDCPDVFINDDQYILFQPQIKHCEDANKRLGDLPLAEVAGPRDKIFFNPKNCRAAIVTCGGLCPGINDVIRGLYLTLHNRYGVREVLGIRYGYQGFIPDLGQPPIPLTLAMVDDIHKMGGSILGSSRGPQDTNKVITFLQKHKINLLFVIGGDGTIRGALEIANAAEKLKLELSVIGIPKTIDNDILFIDQSFGFESAFSKAVESISSAHNEALGAPRGVGLVKLMGRNSGFIACFAALAMNDVNFVLIPEVPFELEGPHGFLEALNKRMTKKDHAVIVVAEGAGQDLMAKSKTELDASGNVRLNDIGLFLKEKINAYFKSQNKDINLKYIDPSYIIRSIPASPQDSVYCLQLAEHAVHAAMSGRTKLVIGKRNDYFVHLPMPLIARGRKTVDPHGSLWMSVLNATGQQTAFLNRAGQLQ